MYCALDEIDENFAVITADDFYGDEPFKLLSLSLDNNSYAIIGYKLADTLSKNGAVNRGVVISHDGLVDEIIESSCIIDGNKVKCEPLDKNKKVMYLEKNNSVSMLMYGFTKDLIKTMNDEIVKSFNKNKDNLLKFEFMMPDIITTEIKNGKKVIL